MALAIDASSPAIATQTNGATATVTTASFTPPLNSILLVSWSGNTASGADPGSTPTVTDNRGTPLTYGQAAWSHRSDTPNADGQAAIWTAHVTSSAAMTVTVTNTASSGNRHAALKVYVITGADTSDIDGATGKAGSTSAASIAQNYTAQQTSAQGFIAVCDWDVTGNMTAGTGCTRDGSAAVGTAITYGFLRRTSADDSNGVTNTLNVTLGGTSNNVRWAYVEIRVAAGGTDATPTPAVVATTASVPRPNVNISAGPAVAATVAALPRPNVNVTAGPAVLAATTTLPRPDVNVSAGPAVLATTTTLPRPAVNVSAAPGVVATTVTLPTPIPDVAGNATVQPATIATVTAVPRPGVNIAAGPAVVPVTVTLPQPGVNVTAAPAVIACTVALATPTIDAGAGASPATVTTTVAVQATAVSVGASPATVAVTVTIPIPTTGGAPVKAFSESTVVHAIASVAAVTALRTSSPTVLAAATSTSTVG